MIVATAALAAFTFSGGAPNAFANKLFDETKQAVMVCQATPARIPKVEFDPADINTIVSAFRSSETMLKMPGVEMTFLDSMIQPEALSVYVQLKTTYPISDIRLPAETVQDGKVTIKMLDTQTVKLESLTSLPFSKKLVIHPVLGSLRLSLRIEEMPERDFLVKLAKLVGGHLKTTLKESTILPYGPEFGKRAERTLRMTIANVDKQKQASFVQAVETRIALIKELTEPELLEALDPASKKRDFSMVSKNQAAAAFVAWLRIQQQDKPSPGAPPTGAVQIDPRSVVWAKSTFRVDTQLNVTALLTIYDSNTRQERNQTVVITRSGPGSPGRPPELARYGE
ncbi:MAG: hypothetical protein KF784_11125 [Fimbriimonadaceae bacterium]|nr:hypothetical protein [Fimbriimonadaceae bacterium]